MTAKEFHAKREALRAELLAVYALIDATELGKRAKVIDKAIDKLKREYYRDIVMRRINHE